MTTLRCETLTTGYKRDKPVLRNITAVFPPGITAVIGPNGAGKSTLLRALLTTCTPWSGQIYLDEKPLNSYTLRERARRIAYIAQRSTISTDFTCRDVVQLGRYSAGSDPTIVEKSLQRTAMLDLADTPFHHLSVGQQQRIALTRALAQLDGATHTPILLADEPVASMDPSHARLCFTILRDLADRGAIIIIVLHDLTHAIRVADQALILNAHGSVAADGPTPSTLSPSTLAKVFAVDFDHASLPHGEALIPAGADTIRE